VCVCVCVYEDPNYLVKKSYEGQDVAQWCKACFSMQGALYSISSTRRKEKNHDLLFPHIFKLSDCCNRGISTFAKNMMRDDPICSPNFSLETLKTKAKS
jgi:hypothetical protein